MTSPSPSQAFGYGQPTGSKLDLGMGSLQRGIGSVQQFPGRLSGTGNHLPGHVTPTSLGMPNFSTPLPSSLPQPQQQPSPNSLLSRGLANRNQLNQEMKRLMGIGGPVGGMERMEPISRGPLPNPRGGSTLGMGGFGLSHSNRSFSHGLMGTALDLSEFPQLTNRAHQEGSLGPSLPPNPMAGRPPYGTECFSKFGDKFSVGMVKQPTSETNEFQIHNEDFPALPGSQNQEISQDLKSSLTEAKEGVRFSSEKPQGHKRGIQTTKDGHVMNIPSGMVTDQFGMVGLLTFIRAAETDPNLVSLALGSDLTTLGLNLNSPENLYPTFGGPWSDHPCKPQDIDYPIPVEYLINQSIREKLAPIKLNRYGEDLLFFLFYMYSGDLLQVATAEELYKRDWRFHKDERVWITRAPGMVPSEKTTTYERGTYYFFDAVNWRKVAKEFHLDYDRLEERPQMVQYNTSLQNRVL